MKPGNRKELAIRVRAHASKLEREQDQGSLIHISDSAFRMPGPSIDDGQCRKAPLPVRLLVAVAASLIVSPFIAVHPAIARAQARAPATGSDASFKQPRAPIEWRVEDLLSRMTLEEKVRQLDLHSGATALIDAHTDDTHAAATAHLLPDKAHEMWGDLGVGAIHDLNPTPDQTNATQKWVLAHNRLGIPVLSSQSPGNETSHLPSSSGPVRGVERGKRLGSRSRSVHTLGQRIFTSFINHQVCHSPLKVMQAREQNAIFLADNSGRRDKERNE